ncbi:MAG: chemotaxis protein CheX [Thermodesulfobacteriota bacterium]
MDKVLLMDCQPELMQTLSELFGDQVSLQTEISGKNLNGFKMVVIQDSEDRDGVLRSIRSLRYALKFRNVPLVLIRNKGTRTPVQQYIMAGAAEVLSLGDHPAACRQILKSYLIPSRQPLDQEQEYLAPFINNTRHVLKTMAAVEAEFQEVYFSNDLRIFGDVSGIIGLSGEAEGTVVVTFYWNLARTIIAKMMQVDGEGVNAELIHDGVGELVNMISGASKKDFVGKPYHFELSLPTVIVGSGHQIGHPDDASIAVLIFDVGGDSFALQVSLKPRK